MTDLTLVDNQDQTGDSLQKMGYEALKSYFDMYAKESKKKRKKIEKRKTPKRMVKRRPDGMDYIEEADMRRALDEDYPGWSWLPAGNEPIKFLGGEWVVVSGVLEIIDNGLKRKFFSVGAARVQYKRGTEHTANNIIDIDKNAASANTNAFKRAINRLAHEFDDVYRKIDLTEEEYQTHLTELKKVLAEIDNPELTKKIDTMIKDGKIHPGNIERSINKLRKEFLNGR